MKKYTEIIKERLSFLRKEQEPHEKNEITKKPSNTIVENVLISCCTKAADGKRWISGFQRESDHFLLSPRRAGQIFGCFEPPKFQPKIIRIIDQAYFGGVLFPFYGHFLIESLSRLPNIDSDNIPIVYMSLEGSTRPWQAEFFKSSQLHKRIIVAEDPASAIHVAELIRVDQTTTIHADISKKFIDYTSKIFPTSPSKGRKIYLSRKNCKNATTKNEDALEIYLTSKGFEIISPEKLSLNEQVKILNESSIVVGIEGSALHTLIFTTAPLHLIILVRRKKLDHNFILQLSLQPNIRTTEVLAMSHIAENFSATSTIDLETAVSKIELALNAHGKPTASSNSDI